MVVRQTDKDETEVRVYKYGLVPIGYLSEQAISELWRANKLWNSLVALHYKSRDDFEEARCAAHLLYGQVGEFHGMALRKPDAECTVVICDPRIDRFSKIAPKRFEGNYFEGRKIASTSTKSERSWRLRKDALEHHGKVCMACGFIPEVLRQLEVHHLNPLADQGPSQTSLDEVAVLCRNCHGLAHDTKPPIPLADLKKIAMKSKNKKPSLPMI